MLFLQSILLGSQSHSLCILFKSLILQHVNMSSYLFSSSSSASISSTASASSPPSAVRSHITASLLSMGFPLSRVQPLVQLLNPSQPNAIEVALELLTRDDSPTPSTPSDPDDSPLPPALRHRRPPPPIDSDEVGILCIMTGCNADEAVHALGREGDVNAAAEWILQRQEQKAEAPPISAEEAEAEERRLEAKRARRRERRKAKVAEYTKAEEGAEEGKRFLRFGDVLLIQHVQTSDMMIADSDANTIRLAPYALTPSLSSPRVTGQQSAVITSPLSLPLSQSFSTPKANTSLPSAVPPHLSLAASSPSSAGSSSLLSSSPPKRVGGGLSAFLSSSPMHGGSSPHPPLRPLASPHSQSTDRPFPSLSLSPIRSPGKPRSFSSPRKSSHPLSFSLPSHHRYHLTIRRAPSTLSSDSDHDENGLIMSGDEIVLETYERCYLCVEADGSIGCNRTLPLTQQMHFSLHVEEKTQEGGEEEDDMRALESQCVVSLSTLDRHYVGVEGKQAVAKQTTASLSHHFSLSLAHKSTSHHKRHTRSSSTSSASPLPSPSRSAYHWSYLRTNFRLLAISLLNEAIAEKQVELLQRQRTQRLHREDAKRLCSICLDRSCEVVLLECGHSCSCEDCAKGLKECVVCRQKVHRVVVIRAA